MLAGTIYCNLYISGNYVLNYVATRPKLQNYVSQGLIQVNILIVYFVMGVWVFPCSKYIRMMIDGYNL